MNNNILTTDSIRKLQAGDDKPLSELMERYKLHIWPLILAESRNYQDAEDILNSTWQTVWENINGLRDVSSFGGWLRKIAYNQCRRYYNNAYHSEGERPYEDETLTWHVNRSAEILLREEELKADVVETVQHLPSKPEYVREVAILFYLDGLTLKELWRNLICRLARSSANFTKRGNFSERNSAWCLNERSGGWLDCVLSNGHDY